MRISARSTGDVVAVFAGKLGGIAASLVFLPTYALLLDGPSFGLVAIILSIQSLFLVFDLGFATIIGTDVATARGDPLRLAAIRPDWHRIELAVLGLAITGALTLILTRTLGGLPELLTPTGVILASIFIGAQIGITINHSGLNALQCYRLNSFLLVGGTLLRAIVTILLLRRAQASVDVFLTAQAAISVVHFGLSHVILARYLGHPVPGHRPTGRRGWILLLSRIRPLVAYTLAGAIALQLDKPIVGSFFSLEDAGRYFLATTYAATPVAVLGGPLFQYFFPQVLASTGPRRTHVGMRFQFLTVCAVTAPAIVLAFFVQDWLSLWLPHMSERGTIAAPAGLLVCATAIGATGYLPTTIYMAEGRQIALARLSVTASLCVTVAALVAAASGIIFAVAIAYATYYIGVCAALWIGIGGRRELVVRSYLAPLLSLAGGSLLICSICEMLLPSISRAFAAAAACGALTAVVALLWWHRYERAWDAPLPFP